MSTPAPGHELTTDDELRALLGSVSRVAVLGIKTAAQADQAAFYVPSYLASAGVEVLPVPTYYPEVTSILGRPVFRSVAAAPGPIDIVDVFRRPSDLMPHLDDLVAAKPRVVWLQTGITHPAFCAALRAAGIDVVQDRCLMVEHQRLTR